MDVELIPGSEFVQLAARLRAAPPELRKEMSRAVKQATEPAETDLKAAVMGVESKATKGGGGKQRSAYLASRSRTGKLPRHTGLRKNVARGITRKITYSGSRIGVRVRADFKYLPADQAKLGKLMNSGKRFRHPVMGDKEVWVNQQFTPDHWFDNTMKKYAPRLRAEINAAARRVFSKLQ